MKRVLLLGVLLLSGCEVVDAPRVGRTVDPRCDAVLRGMDLPPVGVDVQYVSAVEVPFLNLPESSRTVNYGGGSCVCASLMSCLKWEGRDDLVVELRKVCVGGQSSSSIMAHASKVGIRFAVTTSGDTGFLSWCARTRRGACIFWKPNHSCTLVDLTDTYAIILDNNHVSRYEYTPRDEFLRKWRSWGGFAMTPLYEPAPPLAYVE